MLNRVIPFLAVSLLLMVNSGLWAANGADPAPVSEATQECLDCHATLHPGIVADWQASRHARQTVAEAMAVEGLGRKVSAEKVAEPLLAVAVGCAECHTLRSDAHPDSFEHNGYEVHMVVSPADCATCHTQEADQYNQNLMSHAVGNLADNPVYQKLVTSIIGKPEYKDGRLQRTAPDAATKAEACFYCHGTTLKVAGETVRDSEDFGEMSFPIIEGWPNQGVGRINPDGSKGACSACHTRHEFSMAVARKPYTCQECHVGPDVPAYKVYAASKHGNLFASHQSKWNFETTPWTVGKDFTAPTCASCHLSLVVNTEGTVLAERSHSMKNRLPWRLYGLIYAHPHPIEADTTLLKNADGQTLPTTLAGKPADKGLIDKETQVAYRKNMQAVCLGCHSTGWVEGHWARLEATIAETNQATRLTTEIMQKIWSEKLADAENPFDETVEGMWVDSWLLYSNTIRFASAMAGGGDYGVFAGGRYPLSRVPGEMLEWREVHLKLATEGAKVK